MKKLLFFAIMITYSCKSQEKKEYTVFLKEIITNQNSFKNKYTASNSVEKKAVIIEARKYLTSKMGSELFPYWYGTKWDFNGMTRTPKKGKIACGYFVTNTLTDVGFNIPRIKWAQSASEVFIKKLSYGNLKRFSNKPIATIEKHLLNTGNGIYIVGLDSHTGYIYVKNNEIRFVHADYFDPETGVTSEKIDSDSPINYSKYRIIGKLMSDQMILAWIKNTPLR